MVWISHEQAGNAATIMVTLCTAMEGYRTNLQSTIEGQHFNVIMQSGPPEDAIGQSDHDRSYVSYLLANESIAFALSPRLWKNHLVTAGLLYNSYDHGASWH